MRSGRKTSVILPIIVVALLVLPAAYIGSYCLMVEPHWKDEYPEPGSIVSVPRPRYSRNESLSSAAEVIFAPLHWVDRHIRARLWSRDRGVESILD